MNRLLPFAVGLILGACVTVAINSRPEIKYDIVPRLTPHYRVIYRAGRVYTDETFQKLMEETRDTTTINGIPTIIITYKISGNN